MSQLSAKMYGNSYGVLTPLVATPTPHPSITPSDGGIGSPGKTSSVLQVLLIGAAIYAIVLIFAGKKRSV